VTSPVGDVGNFYPASGPAALNENPQRMVVSLSGIAEEVTSPSGDVGMFHPASGPAALNDSTQEESFAFKPPRTLSLSGTTHRAALQRAAPTPHSFD